MKNYFDYNRIAKKILENGKTKIHNKLCFNLLHKSLKIERNFFGTYHLLGIYYHDLGDYNNAEIFFKKSINLNQNNIPAYLNLFTIYHKQEKIKEAIVIGNKLIGLENFNFNDFYVQLGMMYLLNGDFVNGWKYYRFNESKENLNDIINYEGEVVITEEQGLGDNILFSRFGKLLKDKGVKVSYACSPDLINLIKSSKIYYKVYNIETIKRDKDKKYISLLNLPFLFNIDSINSKIHEPYFFVDKKKVEYWKSKINSQKLVIGISWQGKKDPENEFMEGRSFPLTYFENISKFTHIQLVSLQKGFGREQLETCNFIEKIVDFGNDLSLDDVSAIIMNCDIIISPCTMISHLSGSLGKDTWVLIKKISYWFWGLSTEENFWYSSIKLFRQTENGNWHHVFKRIEDEIKNKRNLQINKINN